jgi:hypothetical protein
MRFLLGFGWGIVLLASFAGWGLAVQRALKTQAQGRMVLPIGVRLSSWECPGSSPSGASSTSRGA